jgi:hypothetical protein
MIDLIEEDHMQRNFQQKLGRMKILLNVLKVSCFIVLFLKTELLMPPILIISLSPMFYLAC